MIFDRRQVNIGSLQHFPSVLPSGVLCDVQVVQHLGKGDAGNAVGATLGVLRINRKLSSVLEKK